MSLVPTRLLGGVLSRALPALRLCAMAWCWMLASTTHANAQTWPVVPLPPGTQAHEVGQQLVVNGSPMRVQAFMSERGTDELVEWFKQKLGGGVVTNKLGNKTILGRAEGEFFETIQIESDARGTHGVVAVSHLRGTREAQGQSQERFQRLLARMPADTKVVTEMASTDLGKNANYLVVNNTQTEAINRERITRLMVEDGYTLERITDAADQRSASPKRVQPQNEPPRAPPRALLFRAPGKEAIATISQDSTGRTTVVLNTVTGTTEESK
jgi:hypothetical protein